jgi:DNA invertase Pin-like site-specific DNA recombinase
MRLIDVVREMDVSGGTPLDRRPGLRRAVELVEAGKVDTIIVVYMDRFVRSVAVQLELVERVERAGGTSSPSTTAPSQTGTLRSASPQRCWAPSTPTSAS